MMEEEEKVIEVGGKWCMSREDSEVEGAPPEPGRTHSEGEERLPAFPL